MFADLVETRLILESNTAKANGREKNGREILKR